MFNASSKLWVAFSQSLSSPIESSGLVDKSASIFSKPKQLRSFIENVSKFNISLFKSSVVVNICASSCVNPLALNKP